MNSVIQFRNVSKKYFLGSRRAYLSYLTPDFLHRKRDENGPDDSDELWALKDVSFDVYNGEVLGLIGPNGAGKTTALSLLAGITEPTSGHMSIRGRIGALIKLGAGFHPELTGRENVYLNGSILGLRRAEIDKLYDKIVQFSELDRFMDTPVKRYSSGMYVRLGFAVAVHIDPEILLVDEVLSVGDVSFQTRCFNRIGELSEKGTTIVFVSHNMHHINSFCDRVIYLRSGEIRSEGKPDEVIAAYTADFMKQGDDALISDGSDFSQTNGTGRVTITGIEFLDKDQQTVKEISSGDPLTVRVRYQCNEEVENPLLDLVIRDAARGNMFQATNRDFGVEFGRVHSSGYFEIRFPKITSNNQVLNFFFTLWNSKHTEQYDWKRFVKLNVMGNPASSGRILFDCEWREVSLEAESHKDKTSQS
jgi:ABC-type polysaccharide/polyol phosphate transport system ATPase subunit